MPALLLLILLLSSTLARAEPPVPLLWKVSQGQGTVYLLGSFHVLKPDDYPLSAALEAAYADAEQLRFEVSPAEMGSPKMAEMAQRYARFDTGQTLRGVLSPETTGRLRTFLGSEAALAAADPFEPWFMSMNLAVMAMMQAGFNPALGLDQHLMKRAAADGKPTAGLETVEDQLKALDGAPLDEQDRMLADALASGAELRRKLDQLHQAWRAGDSVAIEQLINAEMRDTTPQAYRRLNVERNQRWLPQVRALLQSSDDHLVVVGAMHLLGADGLVEQMRAAGLTVERIERL